MRSALVVMLAALACAEASELLERELPSTVVPGPVPYAVLLPEGYKDKRLPLLLLLHGGGGDRRYLTGMRSTIDALWADGKLPKMVVATASVTSRCFYMDYKDGSEKWETFLTGPFRQHLQKTYGTSTEPRETLLMGISMGGMGGLRIAFKHPELFGAVAALEPGIEPILHWKDMQPRHRFWRADNLFEVAFGKPVDAAYWEANNPASIAAANPARLRGLEIYLDVGDEDMFLLDEGTEFLHRVLYDKGVKHEYHLVRGADHVGRTVPARSREALEFLARALNPPGVDPVAAEARKTLEPAKARVGIRK